MKSVLKRTRWARFWSAALVAALLLAGCEDGYLAGCSCEDEDPDDPGDESLEPDDPDPTDPDEPGDSVAPVDPSISIDDSGFPLIQLGPPPPEYQSGTYQSGTLHAVVLPDTADQTVTWESSNPAIATVDSDGVVSAGTTKGTVTITATAAGDLTAQYEVTVYPAPYVPRQEGEEGDNNAIAEYNLLDVLNVDTVAAVLDELHQRLTLKQMGGLKLGMYFDLQSLHDGQKNLIWDNNKQNLRIVIASFNQYKDLNDSINHIKFVFKNIPKTIRMRRDDYGYNFSNNYGGYPYTGGENGVPILKPYLEGGFFDGLKTALGRDYFYEVTRNITGGYYDGNEKESHWVKTAFSAKIFIDTEKEVFGTNTLNLSGTEDELTQTALYAKGGESWQVKTSPSNLEWWMASPFSDNNYNFMRVYPNHYYGSDAVNSGSSYGVVPAFCIK